MAGTRDVDKVSIIGTLFSEGYTAAVNLTDEIISQLPPDKQSGNLLETQEDILFFTKVTVSVILFFGVLYNVYHRLAMALDIKIYSRVNINRQDRVLNTFTNLTSMLVIVSLSIYHIFYMETPTGDKFGWFKSNIAIMTVEPIYGISCVWVTGFFLYDEIVLRLVYTDPYADGDKVTMQHSVHHWLGILWMLSSLCVGYSMPSSLAIFLICELSTIWLNFRFLIDDRDSSLYSFVNIMFAITFTLTRIMFCSYGFVLMTTTSVAFWHRLNLLRRICLVINLTVATGL